MARKVYATLLTSDAYAMGVEALVYSLLRVHARYPVVVLYTPQVTQQTLDKLTRFFRGFETRLRVALTHVDDIAIPDAVMRARETHVPGWVNSGYTKLHIFAMEQYDAIVYIDADAVVLENVDELFERKTSFAAAPDVFPPDRFNAGVLLVRPSAVLFQRMLLLTQELPSYDGGDTGFLNAFFPQWFAGDAASRLPFGYNAQRTMYWLVNGKNPGYWRAIAPLKILHFSSNPKPWEDPARKGDLELLWWQIYTESRCAGF